MLPFLLRALKYSLHGSIHFSYFYMILLLILKKPLKNFKDTYVLLLKSQSCTLLYSHHPFDPYILMVGCKDKFKILLLPPTPCGVDICNLPECQGTIAIGAAS